MSEKMKVCGILSKATAIVMEGEGSPGRLKGKLIDLLMPFVLGDQELEGEEKTAKMSEIKNALDKSFVYEELSEEQFARLRKLSTEVHTASGKSIARLIQKRYDFIYSSLAIANLLSQLKDVIASVSRLLSFKAPREKRIDAIQPLFEQILPNLKPITSCSLPYSLERVMKEIRKAPKQKLEPSKTTAEPMEEESSDEKAETEEVAVEA